MAATTWKRCSSTWRAARMGAISRRASRRYDEPRRAAPSVGAPMSPRELTDLAVTSSAQPDTLYPQTGLAASLRRVRALVRRHAYLLLKSWPRIVSMMYYPTVTMVLWAFVTIYLAPTNTFLKDAPGFFLG